MSVNAEVYRSLITELDGKATLVAVSKFKPVEDILALYELGQRDFGENYVQELQIKQAACPDDIRWHFIGHLQTNKVKQILPFVHLIHGVDSQRLLKEIEKQAFKLAMKPAVLLQVHVAQEETKFGWEPGELKNFLENFKPENVMIRGLMAMASCSSDQQLVRSEFAKVATLAGELNNKNWNLDTLSMGMSGDYRLALAEGSTMIRVGSMLFGNR